MCGSEVASAVECTVVTWEEAEADALRPRTIFRVANIQLVPGDLPLLLLLIIML